MWDFLKNKLVIISHAFKCFQIFPVTATNWFWKFLVTSSLPPQPRNCGACETISIRQKRHTHKKLSNLLKKYKIVYELRSFSSKQSEKSRRPTIWSPAPWNYKIWHWIRKLAIAIVKMFIVDNLNRNLLKSRKREIPKSMDIQTHGKRHYHNPINPCNTVHMFFLQS